MNPFLHRLKYLWGNWLSFSLIHPFDSPFACVCDTLIFWMLSCLWFVFIISGIPVHLFPHKWLCFDYCHMAGLG